MADNIDADEASLHAEVRRITDELNDAAENHPFGQLQAVRQRIKNFRQARHKIFSQRSVKRGFGFHAGGQGELQFNIGLDVPDYPDHLRFGVAFSFEPSQSFHDTRRLVPKVERFNDYLAKHPELVHDLSMWENPQGGDWTPVAETPNDVERLIENKTFLFLGRFIPKNNFNAELVLNLFQRLLPLYEYVEDERVPARQAPGAPVIPAAPPGGAAWQFVPGGEIGAARARFVIPTREVESKDRHRQLLARLQQQMVGLHGPENVGVENPDGRGGLIDLVRRDGDGFWFFEVKAYSTARACIREAVGQLLEYSLFPPLDKPVTHLVIVGEPALDTLCEQYLEILGQRFPVPLSYHSVSLA